MNWENAEGINDILLEVMSLHLSGETKEIHEKIYKNFCPGRDSNRAPSEFKSEH
jgi:hypothetical protein